MNEKTIYIDTTRFLVKVTADYEQNRAVAFYYDKFKIAEPYKATIRNSDVDVFKRWLLQHIEELQNSQKEFTVITKRQFHNILNSDIIRDVAHKY